MFTELLLLITSLVTVFIIWQKRTHTYWQRNGVKCIKPLPIVGNVKAFLTGKVNFFEQMSLLHTAKGFENEPLIGVYLLRGPAILVRDLDLIKTIMIKKFNYFVNRALQTDPHRDPLGYNNLFFVRSPEWKGLRNKISPVFTSGKIKQMYPLMLEIGKDLESNIQKVPTDSEIRIKDTCARFTTDLIATIAFGVKANSLSNIKSEFFNYNMAIFELCWQRALDLGIIFMLPALASIARVKLFSKKTSDFFFRTISYVLSEREKSGVHRNDLIDVLLAMKQEAAAQSEKGEKALKLDYLVAQAALFQTAGFETSSSTMTMSLYELALNNKLQDRLRAEVKEYFGDEDHISYERLQEMPYLSQVVNETLRKYPIVGYAERECLQPESGEKFSLKPYYDLEVPSGMPFYVSTLAIHRDEKYWPDPDKYDPERFAPENRDNINMDAYMPFGIGPRNCIGMRLGLLQTKLGLVHLLRNHKVLKCDKTVESIKFQPLSPVLSSDVDILLRLQRD
ncbi:probable cytochrome P450 6w1 [Drosophila sulfurigaster albostrigata]|uniref:probable cytochrome P450 6w1 n=1 Tax=Drosophila sulfurigaster albostrigata TaxID=89887 RepID=UPI002D21BEF8|nr:probable cytochrome P450 6w1 [Drosophila sulfurigaster albostrigata]